VGGGDLAGLRDYGLDDDGSSDVGGAGYGWVDGLDGGEEQAGGDSFGDMEWAGVAGGGDDAGGCAGTEDGGEWVAAWIAHGA